MIRRPTWIALLLLAALAGFTFYLRQKPKTPAAAEVTPTPADQALFASEKGTLTEMAITSAEGQTVEIARGSDRLWVLKQPGPVPADQGQAEAAATQVSVIQNLGPVDAPLDAVGLAKPAYTVKVTFGSGPSHTLEIGDKTPSEAGYYGRLDGGGVIILSESGVASLLTLLTAPPYQETPTASPVPPTDTATLPPVEETPPAATVTP